MSDMSLDPLLTAMLSQQTGKTTDSVLELSQRRTAILTYRESIDRMEAGIDQLDTQLATVVSAEESLGRLRKRIESQRDHLQKGRDGLRNAIRLLEDSVRGAM